MRVGLLGRKVGMTQIYETDGTAVPVTVLECGPCTVLQVRTEERDGYHAVQLGYADRKRKNATQAARGHAKKVGAEPKRYIREIRQSGPSDLAEGQTLTVDVFNEIGRVDVIGTSKGRGFSGVIKRHNFGGLRMSHGVKKGSRQHGSIASNASNRGSGRPKKGIRMAGQMGNAQITTRNLTVVKIDTENNLLLVRGAIPGPNGGLVLVKPTNKKKP